MDALKGSLKSKTIWFNVLTLMSAAGSLLTGVVTPEVLTVIVTIGNIGLRFMTSDALSDK